jgi:thymidylate synthase (FAD)
VKVTLVCRPQFLVDRAKTVARDDQLIGTGAEQLTEYFGRKCYDSLGKGRSSEAFHKHLLEVGHGSVLEHAVFSFEVDHVSRGFTHELVRHRVGVAISQRSTRYVDESGSPYVTHPVVEEMDRATESLSDAHSERVSAMWKAISASVDADRRSYDAVVAAVEPWLISRGVDKATARKQARGAARGYLGNAIETELGWSANVRTLRHVSWLRGSIHADAEARLFAMLVVDAVKAEVPAYFADRIFTAAPDGGVMLDLEAIGAMGGGA